MMLGWLPNDVDNIETVAQGTVTMAATTAKATVSLVQDPYKDIKAYAAAAAAALHGMEGASIKLRSSNDRRSIGSSDSPSRSPPRSGMPGRLPGRSPDHSPSTATTSREPAMTLSAGLSVADKNSPQPLELLITGEPSRELNAEVVLPDGSTANITRPTKGDAASVWQRLVHSSQRWQPPKI